MYKLQKDDQEPIMISDEEMLSLFQVAYDYDWYPENEKLGELAVKAGLKVWDVHDVRMNYSGSYVADEPKRKHLFLNMRSMYNHSLVTLFKAPDLLYNYPGRIDVLEFEFARVISRYVICRIEFLCGYCAFGIAGKQPISDEYKKYSIELADELEYLPSWWKGWYKYVEKGFKGLIYQREECREEVEDMGTFLADLNSIMKDKVLEPNPKFDKNKDEDI